MRGGLERWKRGTDSHGVRAAIAYALDGDCDAHIRVSSGVTALAGYSEVADRTVTRFTAEDGTIVADRLDREQLCAWVDGRDPLTGERRGRELLSPNADLVLDGTINAPKSFSLVAMIHPELAVEFEALQDRLRDRIVTIWQAELNARRGAGGRVREELRRVEVVELRHRRSRALDPHVHRHLWLSVKVQGRDGAWSNVDSRVAMRLHTVINAEGELAARTDPEWVAALARHGYTLNEDGEVAQVAHTVRALSRRSTQIEANRARMLTTWRAEHPGMEPDHEVLQQIDRHAWKHGRPRKPTELHEDEWEQLIRAELAEIDPHLLEQRPSIRPIAGPGGRIDVGALAARAVAEADARASGTSGRFSRLDVRAGAMRAVAAYGLAADRATLQPLIDDVTKNALKSTVDLLMGERPDHVKGFMAATTAELKVELACRFDRLALPGVPLAQATVTRLAAMILPSGVRLDAEQGKAVAAIAGTDRLVTVTGPAGAGKTTMLRIVHEALKEQGRRLVLVAPTKKAAAVAGRQVGADASSLHALLADHGWRWCTDNVGAPQWSRLHRGDIDPVTGIPYFGPTRPVRPEDRILVDEAGMVDLQTARALAIVAEEIGAGIAMVGDPLQAMPVGHAGAMACMTRRCTAAIGLTAVHRFHDPDYAALTLRLREPASRDDAIAVATELDEHGHIHRLADASQAREVMVEAYFRWTATHRRVALVTSTNDEADAVNEAIQQRRIDLGHLTTRRLAIGRCEQRLLEGDVVQTRRNDRHAGVENRAIWTVGCISGEELELVSVTDPVDVRTVSHEYAAEHIHLAYASTVHGIQGETTDASIVGPGVDASGLYVGMTRGRFHNEALTIARTASEAREQIADSMTRGLPEVSIDDSIDAARRELARAARPPANDADEATCIAELEQWTRDCHAVIEDAGAAGAADDASTHARPTAPRGRHHIDPGEVAALERLRAERETELADLYARWDAPTRSGIEVVLSPPDPQVTVREVTGGLDR